ncbi:bifunctional serine/threonine-protein kinase/formylglycine-generating enzyme family protein [Marinicella meishanensis]|uniref:bifunctional serine/threonine-protein kinase/formylglycine-generating enzyme family protein n=1 Tax=Marinicella meishanensis TaxID=2873263 RepID=UPI001CBBDA36|nr:bifunctional serine/threonine-protein kinase/formylglycine-generating enzyme family protein [Marinicella sp. NBU2979]
MKTVPKLNLNIPDHTILDKIGEGGMSAVYLGRQISLQRKVAIKVLKKLVMDDKNLAERFVDEAKTVASLDHPHIISIYEAKKLPSGLAYFTMPYLTHGDFGEIICTSSDHLIELLCQICDGLSHAHQHGIIHRDLKPDNILFDQFGRIKIADFGIAISKNTKRKTKETQLLGSAHFMSPEQIQSKEIDRHSDIYSLGCIIYEKLTGDHVFQANNDFSILMSHINKPIPELPAALAEWQPIIDNCLAKDPNERYDTVEELKDALLAIKYGKHRQPAETPTATQPGHKKPYLWGALAGLVLVAMAALFFTRHSDDEPVAASTEVVASETQAEVPEPVVEATPSKPLELSVGVVTVADEAAEEKVDLTGNLDNETINQMSVEVTLNEAQELLQRYRLTKPKGDNAADKFYQVLLEQPNNEAARNGLHQVGRYYFNLIDRKLEEQAFDEALTHLESFVEYLDAYQINSAQFDSSISNILSTTQGLVNQAVTLRRNNPLAERYLNMSAVLKPDYAFVTDLQNSYNNIPQTGDVYDDQLGHRFIFFAVPNGSTLTDFLLGEHEVTVGQFAQFAGDGMTDDKCHHFDKKVFFKKTWEKPPFEQSNSHPVVCVTAAHAEAYANWLSDQTGHRYRLPTNQEYQLLNRQLTTQLDCQVGNLAGQEIAGESKATDNPLACESGAVFTTAVKSHRAQTGVHDFVGNVSEWATTCGTASACAMGTSWRSGAGTTNNTPVAARPDETHSHIGFRLVREL